MSRAAHTCYTARRQADLASRVSAPRSQESPLLTIPTFTLRDRVQVTRALEVTPAFAAGIVVRTFLAPRFYEVWFDGTDGPCVVAANALVLAHESGALRSGTEEHANNG
jgi:hypothetical protein